MQLRVTRLREEVQRKEAEIRRLREEPRRAEKVRGESGV